MAQAGMLINFLALIDVGTLICAVAFLYLVLRFALIDQHNHD